MYHFGIPFDTVDLAKADLPDYIDKYPLIILGHAKVTNSDKRLERHLFKRLSKSVKEGGGLVSFDPEIFSELKGNQISHFMQTHWFSITLIIISPRCMNPVKNSNCPEICSYVITKHLPAKYLFLEMESRLYGLQSWERAGWCSGHHRIGCK
jgi:hypothetical protein